MIIFLSKEDLLSWDLDAHIATGDHDTIRGNDNLVNLAHTLVILNLGNDLDVGTIITKRIANSHHISGLANERGKDHVDALLDTELQIALVVLGDGREIDLDAGQVDALLRAQLAAVLDLADDLLRVGLKHLQRNETIVDEDQIVFRNDLGQVLVVNPDAVNIARLLVLVHQRERDLGTFDQVEHGRTTAL